MLSTSPFVPLIIRPQIDTLTKGPQIFLPSTTLRTQPIGLAPLQTRVVSLSYNLGGSSLPEHHQFFPLALIPTTDPKKQSSSTATKDLSLYRARN